jgi:hypothetical protein
VFGLAGEIDTEMGNGVEAAEDSWGWGRGSLAVDEMSNVGGAGEYWGVSEYL